jgi:hypothetical protein
MDGIAIAGPAAAAEVIPAAAFTWVDTGDPIPGGPDTVVERERTAIRSDGSAVIAGAAARGLNVRTRVPVTLSPGSPPGPLPVATPCQGRSAGPLGRLVSGMNCRAAPPPAMFQCCVPAETGSPTREITATP